MEPDEEQRAALAHAANDLLPKMFDGSKKAAYTAARVNSGTWARFEAGEKLRADKLVAIVKALWPEAGGDWQKVPAAPSTQVDYFFPAASDPETLDSAVEDRLAALETRIEELAEAVSLMLGELDSTDAESDGAARVTEIRKAPRASPPQGGQRAARAARTVKGAEPALKKRRREHDESTEAVPDDPTGMEPL